MITVSQLRSSRLVSLAIGTLLLVVLSGCLPGGCGPGRLPDLSGADQTEAGGSPGASDGGDGAASAPAGDSGLDRSAAPGGIARVVISPAGLLLTGAGETARLTAKAFDAAGAEVAATFTWASSDPAVLSIDDQGQATARAALGSAQITAAVGEVRSAPVLAIVAKPAPGAILITDRQVIGEPTPVDANAKHGPGYRYRATLGSVPAPPVGTVVLGTGDKPLAGRVVEVVSGGETSSVVLEVVRPGELFSELKFQERIDLARADVEIPPHVAAIYDVSEQPDETIQYTPRPPATGKRRDRQQAGTRALFDCEADPTFPINFSIPPIVSITKDITVDIGFNIPDGGPHFIVRGDAKAVVNLSPKLALNLAGSYRCDATLAVVPVPVPPWLRLIIYPEVALGLGVEAAGAVNAFQLGYDISGETRCSWALGYDSATGMVCRADVERKPLEFKPVVPNPDDLLEQSKLDLSLQGYVWAEIQMANPFLRDLKFETFKARFGPKLSLSLEHPLQQVNNPAGASGFKLSLAGEAGAGSGIDEFMKALSIQFVETKLTIDIPLYSSPKGVFTITPDTVAFGDAEELGEPATFKTVLDTSTFVIWRVVDEVEYRWLRKHKLEPARPLCNSIKASDGQTVFECQTDFLQEHIVQQTFYAFYKARLFGVALPFPLEVADDAKATVTVTALAEFHGLGFLSPDCVPRAAKW